jgi:hypothetical protein
MIAFRATKMRRKISLFRKFQWTGLLLSIWWVNFLQIGAEALGTRKFFCRTGRSQWLWQTWATERNKKQAGRKSFLSSISFEQSLLPSSMIDIFPPRNTSNMTIRWPQYSVVRDETRTVLFAWLAERHSCRSVILTVWTCPYYSIFVPQIQIQPQWMASSFTRPCSLGSSAQ